MTLKSYYSTLPERSAPKSEFVKRIAMACGVDPLTVRGWILYGRKPRSSKHKQVLSEMMGIAEEDLWEK